MTTNGTSDRIGEYTDLPLQQVDGVRRLDGPPGAPLHVENELDAFGREQMPLWEADGILNARSSQVARRSLVPAAKAAAQLARQHRRIVKRAQRRLENACEALGPFVRRKDGQKFWFAVRTGLLLTGDVAGQAGAQIYFGEIPELALTQALAAGVAVVTGGLIGGEVKDLRMAARRYTNVDALSDAQKPYAHLFDGRDKGKHIVRAMIGVTVTVGTLISVGIFALRSSIDGPLAGLIYGALAAGIAAASFVSSYVATDEIADALGVAEKAYERAVKRQLKLAGNANLKSAFEHGANADSVLKEHDARGRAAVLTFEGLRHRVLRQNPGVVGHGPTADAEVIPGRRFREEGS